MVEQCVFNPLPQTVGEGNDFDIIWNPGDSQIQNHHGCFGTRHQSFGKSIGNDYYTITICAGKVP